jgi:hypothetical protein
MKKVLSFAAIMVFVAGIVVAQNPPAKKAEKKEAKTEMKADTTKKAQHHKVEKAKGEVKKTENKKK